MQADVCLAHDVTTTLRRSRAKPASSIPQQASYRSWAIVFLVLIVPTPGNSYVEDVPDEVGVGLGDPLDQSLRLLLGNSNLNDAWSENINPRRKCSPLSTCGGRGPEASQGIRSCPLSTPPGKKARSLLGCQATRPGYTFSSHKSFATDMLLTPWRPLYASVALPFHYVLYPSTAWT